MCWSKRRFRLFRSWIDFRAFLSRIFSCFIFAFWIVEFFFGLDMVAVVFFSGVVGWVWRCW